MASSSKLFRLILFPLVIAYLVISVFLGGWPFNLLLQDWIFNSTLAVLLFIFCILYARDTFTKVNRNFVAEAAIFIGIILLATFVRYKGLAERRLSGPTIDEPDVVGPVLNMLRSGSYDFQRYEYGGVYFYVLLIVFVFTTIRLVSNFRYRRFEQIPEVEYYTAGRLATAFFSLLTVAGVYIFARKYFGKLAAVTASLILTFSSLSFITAREIRPELILALWVLIAHWFFFRILDEPSPMNYLLAGVFCGLSVGTKFTVTQIFISLLVTHTLAKKERWFNWNLLLSLLCGAVIYIVTNFYALAHLNQFLSKLATAINHNLSAEHWSRVSNRPLEYAYILTDQGIGLVALALSLFTLPRITKSDRLLILWTFPLFNLLMLGSYPSGFARYLIPILPLLSILAGEAFRSIVESLRSRVMSPWMKTAVVPLAILILIAQPSWQTFRHYSERSKILRPQEVVGWIQKNIPKGAQILSDPTGPLIPDDQYKVSYLTFSEFKNPKTIKNYEYVCVTEDLFKRIPPTFDLIHEFPARTKSLDRSIRIYKARNKGSF
jgi:hypothetical protein